MGELQKQCVDALYELRKRAEDTLWHAEAMALLDIADAVARIPTSQLFRIPQGYHRPVFAALEALREAVQKGNADA